MLRHHLWRHRIRGECSEPVPAALCQALENQVPQDLSPRGFEAVARAHLARLSKESSQESPYLCGALSRRQQERKWLRACYGMLPAHEAAFKHHELQAISSETDGGGVLHIVGEGDRLEVLLHESALHLKPMTPRLQEQWESLSDLLHQEQLFVGSSVLQLGLTPQDAVPQGYLEFFVIN